MVQKCKSLHANAYCVVIFKQMSTLLYMIGIVVGYFNLT